MFLLSFAASIRTYTVFLDALRGSSALVMVLFLILGGYVLFLKIQKKKDTKKKREKNNFIKVLISGLCGIIVACSIVSRNLREKNPEFLTHFWRQDRQFNEEAFGWKTINTFGTIRDTQKYQRYIFETEDKKKYILNSQESFQIGDQLFLSANLKPLDEQAVFEQKNDLPRTETFWDYQFSYDKRMFMKGFEGTLYQKQALLIDPENPETMQGQFPERQQLGLIEKIRSHLQSHIATIFGENQYAGLLLGLLIGDKSLIPAEQYTTFVESGLVHIIAVSGGNIAMLVILLSFLLGRVPLYIRNALILLFIFVYAMICGGDSSVIRATIMGSLTLIALFRGREISIRRSMKYAFLVILAINPFALVYDVGFSLSFAAIIGIVLIQKWSEKIQEHTREEELAQVLSARKQQEKSLKKGETAIPQQLRDKLSLRSSQGHGFFSTKFWKEYLIPTIGASLGTAPILMFFMNGVNLVGILLNIIIVPIIPVVTIYGFVALLTYAIIPRSGWTCPEMFLMEIIYQLSNMGAKYAIFVQAKGLFAKYVIVVLFVVLGVWGYKRLMNKKNPRRI
ncbi:MAG: ComEC/Rec2 family competence protein [Candidatus Absconditabacteria bacterium]|nr:ComEC/Rec2 family competence protein [Candidatus Absconditabacteria bacterium]MDD3868554.1 ComEC/Rec2 family competence protein [Candidatus Absconditabacteria bacterium]MDD4714118.1 ComEC/Rec2 family competence protein [Candidatus Absconditabacteria bacterium]